MIFIINCFHCKKYYKRKIYIKCCTYILLYFQFTFCNIEDYEEPVRLILKHHMDITDEKFQEVYPTIKKYIEDLKEFLKNN